MTDVHLHDMNFLGDASASRYHTPSFIRWDREHTSGSKVAVYTDYCLEEARGVEGKFRIAWILEPHAINANPYSYILEHQDDFDLILTHNANMLAHGEKFVWYPNGMSWVSNEDWNAEPVKKTKIASIIASKKAMTDGHKMRHEVVIKRGNKLTVAGTGYSVIKDKFPLLSTHYFSVAIENSSSSWYFTEKLIDCFASRCVPIYWGCPGIDRFFDTSGMIVVSDVDEICKVIDSLNGSARDIYDSMASGIENNLALAEAYKIPEDWIFQNVLKPRGIL